MDFAFTDDQLALQTLSQHSEFLPRLHARGRVRLLWDVCQVPDFRKLMTDAHVRLLGQLYRYLARGQHVPGRLPSDLETGSSVLRIELVNVVVEEVDQHMSRGDAQHGHHLGTEREAEHPRPDDLIAEPGKAGRRHDRDQRPGAGHSDAVRALRRQPERKRLN